MKQTLLKFICLTLLVSFLSFNIGCTPPKLTVFSTYVTRENLASFFVNTPDPALNCPPTGQKLFISWRLTNDDFLNAPLEVRMHLRYHNRTHFEQSFPVTTLCGTYVYSLLNQEFFEKEGLMSYKIELFGNNKLISQWRHIIWVDPITIKSNDNEED